MSAATPIPYLAPKPNVVFVDDDAGNRQAFQASFRTSMNVFTASTLEEVLALLESRTVHVVIADQRMPGTRGSELLALVKERFPNVRRMLVTAYADLEAIIEAVNNGGVSKYFSKPWIQEQIVSAVDQAFEEHEADKQREERMKRLEDANRQLEFALRQRLLS